MDIGEKFYRFDQVSLPYHPGYGARSTALVTCKIAGDYLASVRIENLDGDQLDPDAVCRLLGMTRRGLFDWLSSVLNLNRNDPPRLEG